MAVMKMVFIIHYLIIIYDWSNFIYFKINFLTLINIILSYEETKIFD